VLTTSLVRRQGPFSLGPYQESEPNPGKSCPEATEWPATLSRSALLSFVVVFQSYYYFSSSVSFFQMPDSLRDLTQLVTPVDDRCNLPGLQEFAHDGQVLFARFRQNHEQLLAQESRQHRRCDRTRQRTDHPPTARPSDHDAYPFGI
jgi:hypothetical protein